MNKAEITILKAQQAGEIVEHAAELFKQLADGETEKSFSKRQLLIQPLTDEIVAGLKAKLKAVELIEKFENGIPSQHYNFQRFQAALCARLLVCEMLRECSADKIAFYKF